MKGKCKCIKDNSLRNRLVINKEYQYIKDEENKLYPYYIYDDDSNWPYATVELEVECAASVSEKFFCENFIDIKKERKQKIKNINENR